MLSIGCVTAAWMVQDRRIHIGAFTLVGAWVLSWFCRFLFWHRTPVLFEMGLNIAVFYIFLQLHFWRVGEKNGPVWPVAIMGFELFIFLSHMTKFTIGTIHYIAIINVLFALELITVAAVAVFYKIRELRNAPPRTSTKSDKPVVPSSEKSTTGRD